MITLNDFDGKRKLTPQAKAREENELEQEVKILESEFGETKEEIESFLDRCGDRYLKMAHEARKMLPYKF